MLATLNIIDGIFEHPEEIRAFALSHDFTQAPEFDGVKYPGFCPPEDDRFTQYLADKMSEAMGSGVRINKIAFVAKTEGYKSQQWIHADNNVGNFAGVIYLFDKPGYGTAFWRYNDTQSETMAHCAQLHASHGGTPEKLAAVLQEDGKTDSGWTKTDYADSKFNRLIFYPTDRFHSHYPEASFGDAPHNCRLTVAFFFDLVA